MMLSRSGTEVSPTDLIFSATFSFHYVHNRNCKLSLMPWCDPLEQLSFTPRDRGVCLNVSKLIISLYRMIDQKSTLNVIDVIVLRSVLFLMRSRVYRWGCIFGFSEFSFNVHIKKILYKMNRF